MRAIIVLFSLIVVASAGCPPFWVQYREQCYRYFNEPLPKLAASQYCARYGSCNGETARLLSVENLGKEGFLNLLLNDYVIEPPTFPIWLGLSLSQDPQYQDRWVWETGTMIDQRSYVNWGPNQPGGNEPCVRTLPNEFGFTWREVACDRELRFVCEMSAVEPQRPQQLPFF